jgi:uncharacterized protein (DUF433 family)
MVINMAAGTDLLGIGLYSVSEAALYARIAPQIMGRWIYGTRRGAAVIEPELGASDERDVTFLDFVQALAIRRIRFERPRISLQKIREAYYRARDDFGEQYPFALSSTRIGLFGPPEDPKKQEIWISVGQNLEEAQKYFQLTGRKSGNQMLGEVVRTYAQRLTFDRDTGLATRYIAWPTGGSASECIIMDPQVRFGEPYLQSSGYTARTLYDAYRSEGAIDRAAKVYGVALEQVDLSIEFFDYLKPLLRDTTHSLSL